jgi:hypothetical protein
MQLSVIRALLSHFLSLCALRSQRLNQNRSLHSFSSRYKPDLANFFNSKLTSLSNLHHEARHPAPSPPRHLNGCNHNHTSTSLPKPLAYRRFLWRYFNNDANSQPATQPTRFRKRRHTCLRTHIPTAHHHLAQARRHGTPIPQSRNSTVPH